MAIKSSLFRRILDSHRGENIRDVLEAIDSELPVIKELPQSLK